MTSRAANEYRYEKLTWPEINDAVDLRKVCIVPCGAVEQHGPHLPLDVDLVCPGGIARGAGETLCDKILVLPAIAYGYTGHVMDFPGTINTHYETFIRQVLDVTKSLAYHGFKKIILLNGHGSNMPNLDLAARRTNLETDAECVLVAWWHLLTIDKEFTNFLDENSVTYEFEQPSVFLSLLVNILPFALMPVGYPLGNFGPVTRKPVSEVLRWDRWS